MGMDPADANHRGTGWSEQAVLHRLEMFTDNMQAAAGQQRVNVWHAAGQAVFARQHGQVRHPRANGVDGSFEGVARQGRVAGQRGAAGQVGIGPRLALE